MQKKIYKILGILFLFLGISLFTLTRSSITGAVIGIGIKSQTTFILGLISFAVSAGLFIIGRTALEKIVSPEEFAERVNDAEDDPNKRAIIIDSSAVLDYSPEEVKEMLDRYDAVFVPKEVLKEVKNKERNWGNMNTPRARLLESHIREHKTRIDEHAIGKYQEIARKYLGQTEKAKFYQKIAPILEEENPKKREQMTYKLPHALRQRYINMTRKTLGYIREEREKSKSRKERRRPITVSDLRKKIKDNYSVSRADIEVLATAIFYARHGKTAVIQEKDLDFEQAVDLIRKRKQRNIARYIKCVDPYLN